MTAFYERHRGKPNEQLFPRQVVIQLPKYVTHIMGEPKYKYGQQEQVTVRNHNRGTALERSWNIYISTIVALLLNKTNRTTGFLRRNLNACPQEVNDAAYKGPVRQASVRKPLNKT